MKLAENTKIPNGNIALGSILIFLGIVFLIGRLFDLNIGGVIWPFLVMMPGITLFIVGLYAGNETGQGFAMVGSLVTMVGLVLLFQNISSYWATWSYAWALVAPTSIGLGQWLYGFLKNQPKLVQSGRQLTKVGLSIFLAAAVFFELIIGVSGLTFGHFLWPILLIGLGIFLLLRNFGLSWRSS